MRRVSRVCADSARDQHIFKILTGTPSGAPVHMAAQTLFETKPGAFQDLRVELASVVYDDQDRSASSQDGLGIQQNLHDPVGICGQSGA
jgi:hypothetical protein